MCSSSPRSLIRWSSIGSRETRIPRPLPSAYWPRARGTANTHLRSQDANDPSVQPPLVENSVSHSTLFKTTVPHSHAVAPHFNFLSIERRLSDLVLLAKIRGLILLEDSNYLLVAESIDSTLPMCDLVSITRSNPPSLGSMLSACLLDTGKMVEYRESSHEVWDVKPNYESADYKKMSTQGSRQVRECATGDKRAGLIREIGFRKRGEE